MLIKITKEFKDKYNGNRYIEATSEFSTPDQITEERAKELIALGFAEEVKSKKGKDEF